MRQRGHRRNGLGRASAVAVVGLVLTGCGGGEQEPAAESSPSATPTVEAVLGEGSFPVVEDVDRSSAEDVASTTARLGHSWDTEFDTTQTDALERAKPLMSDEFAETVQAPERNSAQGEWVTAAESQAYSAPQLGPGSSDATAQDYGPNREAFSYTVTWDWIGRDGTTADGEGRRNVQVFVERADEDADWEVVGYVADSVS